MSDLSEPPPDMQDTDNSTALDRQIYALASLLQAVAMVDHLATTGKADSQDFAASMEQLFIQDADGAAAHGGVAAIHAGLTALANMLGRRPDTANTRWLSYAVAVLQLERKLARNKDAQKIIGSRLEHLAFHNAHFSDGDLDQYSDIVHRIADIYQDSLSKFKYRIQVQGSMQHLKGVQTADRIRALLLVAVRAARLWKLNGGTRLGLIFQRGKHDDALKQIMRA